MTPGEERPRSWALRQADRGPSLLALAQRCAQDSEVSELTRARVERARRQLAETVMGCVPGVREERLGGALVRGSEPRQRLCADLFFVMDDATHHRQLGYGGYVLLQALREAAQRLPGAQVSDARKPPRGAVQVRLDEHLAFTLRPAFLEPYILGGLTIPSADASRWISVNPAALGRWSDEVEAQVGPLLRPALRLARLWHGRPFPGDAPSPLTALHLEALALAGCAAEGAATDLLELFGRVLEAVRRGVGQRVASVVPAEAQIHPDLDAALTATWRCEIRLRCAEDSAELRRALAAERAGEWTRERVSWRRVLEDLLA